MLATEDVKAIKTFIREGYRDSEIARQFKVSRLTVRRLRLGQTHKDVTPARSVGLLHKHTPAPAPRKPRRAFTQAEWDKVREAMGGTPTAPKRVMGRGAQKSAVDRGEVPTPGPARPVPERHAAPPEPASPPATSALDVPATASVGAEASPLEPEYLKAARLRHSEAVEAHAANKKRPFLLAGELEETEREVTAAAVALKNALDLRNAT